MRFLRHTLEGVRKPSTCGLVLLAACSQPEFVDAIIIWFKLLRWGSPRSQSVRAPLFIAGVARDGQGQPRPSPYPLLCIFFGSCGSCLSNTASGQGSEALPVRAIEKVFPLCKVRSDRHKNEEKRRNDDRNCRTPVRYPKCGVKWVADGVTRDHWLGIVPPQNCMSWQSALRPPPAVRWSRFHGRRVAK